MILNLVIIVFLIAMTVLWSQYGLFSSLLHLGATIVAGALALALWEPLAYWLMNTGSLATHLAWGVALVLPFGILLIGLRILVDRVVKANIVLPDLVNKICGGLVGLVSGLITAGLVVIGAGFLPLPVAMAGYQPLAISNNNGQVEKVSSLWVGVDNFASGFYSSLSTGAFSSDKPLAKYQPDLVRQSALFRLRPDPNSSTVAVPGSVTVDQMFVHPTLIAGMPDPIAQGLGKRFNTKSNKLVVVHTKWFKKPGTYDSSGTLRLPPTQVRLVSTASDQANGQSDQVKLASPVAFRGKGEAGINQTFFYPVNSDQVTAYGFNQEEDIWFVFIIAKYQNPRFLLARHLRLALPDNPVEDAAKLVAALGGPAPKPEPKEGEDKEQVQANAAELGNRKGVKVGSEGEVLRITDRLPEQISKNKATGLTFDEHSVVSGQDTVKQGSRRGSRRIVEKIANPSHKSMVRLKISGDRAHSLFGAARASAAQVNPVLLEDNQGNQIRPFAYIWVDQGGVQHVNVKDFGYFNSGKQIEAIPRMQDKDELYLYFRVNHNIRITSYKVGSAAEQSVDLPIPAK